MEQGKVSKMLELLNSSSNSKERKESKESNESDNRSNDRKFSKIILDRVKIFESEQEECNNI